MSVTGVGGEVDSAEYRGGCGSVVKSGNGYEGIVVVEVRHYSHQKLIFGLCLLEIELELQRPHIALKCGHGIDAALVENKAVITAVCSGGIVVNHRFVLVGHSHVLVGESPAVGFHACLGGGGGGVVVEIVGVGQVGDLDAAVAADGEVQGVGAGAAVAVNIVVGVGAGGVIGLTVPGVWGCGVDGDAGEGACVMNDVHSVSAVGIAAVVIAREGTYLDVVDP